MTVPWPYSTPPTPGEPSRPSEATPEGAALGREVARFADIEAALAPDIPARCDDCAARLGTLPNQCGETLMDLIKCSVEREPFYCHKGVADGAEPRRLCSGFLLLVRGK